MKRTTLEALLIAFMLAGAGWCVVRAAIVQGQESPAQVPVAVEGAQALEADACSGERSGSTAREVCQREAVQRARATNTPNRKNGASGAGSESTEPDADRAAPAAVATLLQLWWAEAGPNAPRSHAVMAHVLQRYADARGVELQTAADQLVWAHSNALRQRPWLRHLTPACERPLGYRYRWQPETCRAVVARAEAFLRGELRDPSPRATGWRTPRSKALRRALSKGCRRVQCAGGCFIATVRCV